MATYKDIQDWVKDKHDFVPQSCWIAHCKELNGLPLTSSRTTPRVKPCPPDKQAIIEKAFRHFGWL